MVLPRTGVNLISRGLSASLQSTPAVLKVLLDFPQTIFQIWATFSRNVRLFRAAERNRLEDRRRSKQPTNLFEFRNKQRKFAKKLKKEKSKGFL